MPPSCRRASDNLHVPVEQTTLLYQTALLYKEGPEFLRPLWRQQPADAPELFRLGPGAAARNLPAGRMWGLLVNPTALIPVTQPGDLRQDRVGQLIKRVLDGVASDETRRAYSHALEMFLGFCGREGNPMLSAELVARLPGLARRGREVVLHRGSPLGGHQSSDPGGGHGRVDGGRNRRCHQRCERRAPAWESHRQLAHPGAGAGTAFVAGPGEP